MSKAIFLDNTVLSNLALVGQPELVFRLWPNRVRTPQAVLREYQIAVEAGLLPAHAWDEAPVEVMTTEEIALAESFSTRLGIGERSCLALARMRGGQIASDDADARDAAQRLGIPVTGTLGILALAVRRELLTLRQANNLLAEMVAAGYRAPVANLDTLVLQFPDYSTED